MTTARDPSGPDWEPDRTGSDSLAREPGRPFVVTGEGYAGFWVRLAAWIVDGIVLAVITTALAPLLGGATLAQTGPNLFAIDLWGNALTSLVGLVYFVGFWSWRGQTPGKMLLNQQVVRAEDGGRIDVVQALLRYVGLIISFFVFFLGVIWIGFDGRKQGWHDKMAKTVVIRSR
jgi:uncharacterized RDD family membrane protein YckC